MSEPDPTHRPAAHGVRPRAWLALVLAGWAWQASPATAQIPDTIPTEADTVVVEPDVPVEPVQIVDSGPPMSPRAAFIGAMILPGWSQAAFGSYVRGGVYFAGWAGNLLALTRTIARLDNAENQFDLRKQMIRDSLLLETAGDTALLGPINDPDLFEAEIRADSVGNDLRKLVRARKEQREDWIAWSIFWVLASGIDGFVTAHLAEFPASIEVEPGRDRGVTLRFEVPLGQRRP